MSAKVDDRDRAYTSMKTTPIQLAKHNLFHATLLWQLSRQPNNQRSVGAWQIQAFRLVTGLRQLFGVLIHSRTWLDHHAFDRRLLSSRSTDYSFESRTEGDVLCFGCLIACLQDVLLGGDLHRILWINDIGHRSDILRDRIIIACKTHTPLETRIDCQVGALPELSRTEFVIYVETKEHDNSAHWLAIAESVVTNCFWLEVAKRNLQVQRKLATLTVVRMLHGDYVCLQLSSVKDHEIA